MRNHLMFMLVVALGVGALAGQAAAAPIAAHAESPTTTLLRGVFADSATYSGSGGVSVTRRDGARTLRLGRNFRADSRAIRLRMYLATDASGATHVDLGPMVESGAQTFRVPAGVSLSRYRYAIAWCAAVDEPIAQARLAAVRPPR